MRAVECQKRNSQQVIVLKYKELILFLKSNFNIIIALESIQFLQMLWNALVWRLKLAICYFSQPNSYLELGTLINVNK